MSVNDNFDTINGITDSSGKGSRIRIPITNAFNEQVLLDIRKKTASALDIKAQHGGFIGPRAPFGYVGDCTRIVPDSKSANIVKQIFKMAYAEVALTAIVRHLNENHVPTPSQYARDNGLQGNYNDGNGTWNSRSVKYILTNRTYTGCLVQGKEKSIVIGTHEPLVNQTEFDAVQKSLQAKAFHLAPADQSSENILKGKIACGCCGAKMQRKRGTNHADWYFYTCITKNRVGADKCTGMYVREEDIFAAIYHQLKLWTKTHFISKSKYEEGQASLKQEIEKYDEIDPNEKTMRYYEQLILKEISLSEYIALK